jgi:hypothetical protein
MSKQKYPQVATSATTGKPTRSNKRERYSSDKLNAKQDRKRSEAYARNEKYERLTLQKQLESCVPGGSKRQRARILAAMNKAISKLPSVKIAPQTEVHKSEKIDTLVQNAVENDPSTKGKVKRAAKKKVAAK